MLHHQQVIPIAAVITVTLFVGPISNFNISTATFLVCLTVLCIALLLLLREPLRLDAFVSEAEYSLQNVIEPSINRVINAIGGQSGSRSDNVAVVKGSDILGMLPKNTKDARQMVMDMKVISSMLCEFTNLLPDESVSLFKKLKIPNPIKEDLNDLGNDH